MKIVNSRGRVLLSVTKADAHGIRPDGALTNVLYTYSGESCGGYALIQNLRQVIRFIFENNKSAKAIGLLPTPVLFKAKVR